MDRQTANKALMLAEGAKRRCSLPSCNALFSPRRVDQKFCSEKHRKEFYALALEAGVKRMSSRGMHYGRLEKSPRLQRILHVLNGNGALTTLEIQNRAKVCCVGTSISELRKQGFRINCKKNSQGNYEYRLEGIRE